MPKDAELDKQKWAFSLTSMCQGLSYSSEQGRHSQGVNFQPFRSQDFLAHLKLLKIPKFLFI